MSADAAAQLPDAAGHFGRFGGRFVPEALVAALDELDALSVDELTRRRRARFRQMGVFA